MSNKHLNSFNEKHLKAGEVIVAWGVGYIGEMMGKGKNRQHNGILVVTGERVAFYRKGFLGEVLESIPLHAITSIERKSMLGHQTVHLHTSHDALSFKSFIKAEEDLLVQAVEAGRNLSRTPQPVNHIESIRQLSELLSAGILTEEEFQAKKTDLLAKL